MLLSPWCGWSNTICQLKLKTFSPNSTFPPTFKCICFDATAPLLLQLSPQTRSWNLSAASFTSKLLIIGDQMKTMQPKPSKSSFLRIQGAVSSLWYGFGCAAVSCCICFDATAPLLLQLSPQTSSWKASTGSFTSKLLIIGDQMKTSPSKPSKILFFENTKGNVITLVYKGSLWYVLVCTVRAAEQALHKGVAYL